MFELNKNQIEVLEALKSAHEYCLNYGALERETDIPREQLKIEVTALRKMGLVEHVKGLFNDYGEVAGSGFGILNFREVDQLLAEYERSIEKNESMEQIKQAIKDFAVHTWGYSPHNIDSGEAPKFQYALDDFIEFRLKPLVDSEIRLAEQRLIEKVGDEIDLAVDSALKKDGKLNDSGDILEIYVRLVKFLDQLEGGKDHRDAKSTA